MWDGKVVIVTGGASGIGEGLAVRLAREGARAVIVADRDFEGARRVAGEGSVMEPRQVDVSEEAQVRRIISETAEKYGRIDAYFSNAGIHLGGHGAAGLELHTAAQWQRIWQINVQSHVFAIQALLPHFRRQKSGIFLLTASAAGLLNQIGDASYATTKHASVGLAENIAISHGDEGVKVYCLCPQAVDTKMGNQGDAATNPALRDGMLSVEAVVDATMMGIAADEFLILPHKEVHRYMQGKAKDYNRWIKGMQKWRRSML